LSLLIVTTIVSCRMNKTCRVFRRHHDQHQLPRSNKHGRKRSYTEKYDDLHGPVLRPFISVSYTEKKTIVYCLNTRRPYTDSVIVDLGRNINPTTALRIRLGNNGQYTTTHLGHARMGQDHVVPQKL
jgi:hypothetical protein